MKPERIQGILDGWQECINRRPWTPIFPYPCCCVCFEPLTSENVMVDDEKDQLVDICKSCDRQEQEKTYSWRKKNEV